MFPAKIFPHVSHYFTDAHPYWKQDVVVIGGKIPPPKPRSIYFAPARTSR